MHTFPCFGIRFGFDLARGETRTGLALLVRAFGALGPVWRVGRVLCLALVALVVRDGLGPELVARIAVRVFILLGPAMVS